MQKSTAAENVQPLGSCRVPGCWDRTVDCRERSTEAKNALSPCLVEGSEIEERLERPTAENARRRQRTLYPLVLSKTRFTLESGASSVSQTQRIRMLAGERSDFSLKKSSSYTKEIACSRISDVVCVIRFPSRYRCCGAGSRRGRCCSAAFGASSGAFVVSTNFRTIAMYQASRTVNY